MILLRRPHPLDGRGKSIRDAGSAASQLTPGTHANKILGAALAR
jgi:hypothetical protein